MGKENNNNLEQNYADTAKIGGFMHWKVIAFFLMLYDIIAIHAAYFLALWMRFDFIYSDITKRFLRAYIQFITGYAVVTVIVFWFFKIYRSVWRYAGEKELFRVSAVSVAMSIVHAIGITVIFRRMPMSQL